MGCAAKYLSSAEMGAAGCSETMATISVMASASCKLIDLKGLVSGHLALLACGVCCKSGH